MKLFGAQTLERTAAIRGRAIDFSSLSAEPNVILAESPYSPLPASVSPALRNAAGASYLVTLRDQSGPAAIVSVSVHSSVRIDGTGIHSAEGTRGSEFRSWIFSRVGSAEPAISAEDAVLRSFAAFGVRISEPPRFVRRGIEFVPQLGNWRVTFADPIQFRRARGSNTEQAKVVYLTTAGTFAVARADGSIRATESERAKAAFYEAPLVLAQDMAIDLERIVPVQRRAEARTPR